MAFILYSLANLLVSRTVHASAGMRILVLVASFFGIMGHAVILSNVLTLRSVNYAVSDQFLTVEVDGYRHRIPRQNILSIREVRLKALEKKCPGGLPEDSTYCEDVGWVTQRFCALTHGRATQALLVETEDEKLALIPPGNSRQFIHILQERSALTAALPQTDELVAVKRPIGVPVVSTIIVLGVLWNYLQVIELTTGFPPYVIEGETTRTTLGITPLVLLGLLPSVLVLSLNLAAAFGLARGAKWAHALVMALLMIGIAVVVAFFLLGLLPPIGAMVGIVANLAIVYYLTRAHVKAYFGIRTAQQ